MAERGAARLVGWIGWAGLDALGRLALLTGSTIVFSRLITPHDFGLSALVLAIVTVGALFVGAPFEEALAQRRQLRRRHLGAALGVSLALGIGLVMAALAGGQGLARWLGEPDLALLLPVAMASVLVSGHGDILTALARRLRRFNDIAFATLMGHVIGIALAIGVALAGYGVWALIAQRLLVVAARAALLHWCLGFALRPVWAPAELKGMGRFAGFSFLSRLTENLSYLAFNSIVQVFYGTAVLGQVNMAMRLIEPIRGAILGTGHNLAFSFFTRAASPEKLSQRARSVASEAALVTVPMFVGLAVVAPVLVPLVAGPGWEGAVDIAVCLALASALAVPVGPFYTAFSAAGRPEHSFISLVAGFASVLVVMIGFSSMGPLSVGLARLAGDAMRALLALLLPSGELRLTPFQRLDALAPAWMIAAAMGLFTQSAGTLLAPESRLASLALLILAGAALYGIFVLVLQRRVLATLAGRFNLRIPGLKGTGP